MLSKAKVIWSDFPTVDGYYWFNGEYEEESYDSMEPPENRWYYKKYFGIAYVNNTKGGSYSINIAESYIDYEYTQFIGKWFGPIEVPMIDSTEVPKNEHEEKTKELVARELYQIRGEFLEDIFDLAISSEDMFDLVISSEDWGTQDADEKEYYLEMADRILGAIMLI